MNNKYREILRAKEILGIDHDMSINAIKQIYHELIKKYHPDKNENNYEKSQDIIKAYKTIIDYCNNYKISFDEEMLSESSDKENLWWKQFGNDPMWGPV